MLSKIFTFIAVIGLLFFFMFIGLTLTQTVCDNVLRYTIGNFDDRFEISKADFKATLLETERIWESAFAFNLFEYDSEAEFKINLVFDERQQFSLEEKIFRGKLESSETGRDSFTEEYKTLTEKYSSTAREYEIDFALYEKHLRQYNVTVSRWNERGGSPPQVYERLERDKSILEKEVGKLEQKRFNLNSLAEKINNVARENNRLIDAYNTDILTYNNKFGMQREFDQGDYRGNEINIYQFDTLNDLRLTIAHELGHALRLSHVDNSSSVMYYLMGEQNLLDLKLTEEDIEALTLECGL
ncbi:matrixin family metalloprotease [Patescibacteria group bacterium]|nr:matrixin family metalloprotease [Patescibacteria group bacterium]